MWELGEWGQETERQLITNIIHMVFRQEINAIKIESKLWEDWEYRVGEDENYHCKLGGQNRCLGRGH